MISMMLLVVVIGGLVCTAATRTRLVAHNTVLERGKLVAFHAAAGGLSMARHALRRDPDYRGQELRIGACQVTIETTPMAAANLRWRVVVQASHQSFGEKPAPVRHRLEVVLVATEGLPDVLAFVEGGG
jgi:hypothetical protein